MRLHFHKYHGTGNDFIIIDNRDGQFISSKEIIRNLCDRRFGIGADGLLLFESKEHYDFSMRYFNADGGEGTMCGNGGRSITAFAGQIFKEKINFLFVAVDGVHESIITEKKQNITQVQLKMSDVKEVHQGDGYYFLDTGSPHYVRFVENADEINVIKSGKEIRYSPLFAPEGTNVDFVEIKNGKKLFVRTYERGVEDETYSCGTGVTASAIAASYLISGENFNIMTRGGNLKVSFHKEDNTFSDIWLEGPATHVYSGEIEL